MIKIEEINIWSYIDGKPVQQRAITGQPVYLEIRVFIVDWIHIMSIHNSWKDVKHNCKNWNEIKNY